MTRLPLQVGIVGCGLVGRKRAQAIGAEDALVGAADTVPDRADALTAAHGGVACANIDQLIELGAEVVVVAVPHERLASLAERALRAGTHVLAEKPAALGTAEVDRLTQAARAAGRRVKVGFNHRFHPAIARLAAEVHSGRHGDLLHLRARYGHGGRTGYGQEWRAQPHLSGGGELVDQGMHLLDIAHWLAGPLPLHSALLRTHFWEVPVEDNAAIILGEADTRDAPWAMLHVSWTEWKNLFSVEVYCRTAKLAVDGLTGSYGPQRLRIYRMRPELGPPDVEELAYGEEDTSWSAEWRHFAAALDNGAPFLGELADARYAWSLVEEAYAASPYAAMRAGAARLGAP